MEGKKKRVRIVADGNADLRKRIKIIAAKRNITASMWIIQTLWIRVLEEEKYD